MTAKIWIVRKHPFAFHVGHLAAFTIKSTHATKAEALAVVKRLHKHSSKLYTVGCVQLKEKQP